MAGTCEEGLHDAVLRRKAVVDLHRRGDLLALGLLLLLLFFLFLFLAVLQRFQDDLLAGLLVTLLGAANTQVRLKVLVVDSRLGSSCWTVFEFCFRSRKMTKMEMLRQIFPDEHQKFEPNLFHGHLGLVVAVAPALLLLVVGHFLALRTEGTPPPLFGSESLARLTAAGASCLLRGCGGGTWCRIGRGGGKMNVAFKGQAKASPLPPPRWSLGGWLHAPVLIKLPSAVG